MNGKLENTKRCTTPYFFVCLHRDFSENFKHYIHGYAMFSASPNKLSILKTKAGVKTNLDKISAKFSKI